METTNQSNDSSSENQNQSNVDQNVQQSQTQNTQSPARIMMETKVANAKLVCNGESRDITFMLIPEQPSLSAASALGEIRKVLKDMMLPDAVSGIADQVCDMMDNSKDAKLQNIIKKVMPLLQSGNLQKRLYGGPVTVTGSAFVQDTLSKELKGISVHIAVLMEAVKEDPMVLARFAPYLVGGGSSDDTKKGNANNYI